MINNEEKKLVQELLEINKNLYSLYERLYNLELQNQTDSLEYKKVISYIKMVKEELEVEVYNKLSSLEVSKKSQIILYLKKLENKNIDILKCYLRITNSLLYQIRHDKNFTFFKELLNNIFEDINEDEEFRESANNSIYIAKEMNRILENDLDNLTLYFLEDATKVKNNDNYSSLVKIKYDFIFSKKELEDEIIEDNLKASYCSKIYTFSQIYNLEANFIDQCLAQLLHDSIRVILDKKISNKVLEHKKAYIRSLFVLMSEDELENQNYLFNKYIENKNYLIEHPNNAKKEEIIKKLFRNINKDKKLIIK